MPIKKFMKLRLPRPLSNLASLQILSGSRTVPIHRILISYSTQDPVLDQLLQTKTAGIVELKWIVEKYEEKKTADWTSNHIPIQNIMAIGQ